VWLNYSSPGQFGSHSHSFIIRFVRVAKMLPPRMLAFQLASSAKGKVTSGNQSSRTRCENEVSREFELVNEDLTWLSHRIITHVIHPSRSVFSSISVDSSLWNEWSSELIVNVFYDECVHVHGFKKWQNRVQNVHVCVNTWDKRKPIHWKLRNPA
jgi:hypothetical protein